MDLIALSLQKLNREKRERQPNWTETEKQLLLSLTQMHKTILENKGSDTMTIKRKSEAWDEIALRMQAAGFNRSKDRLKQQLGRIRAADAKKFKDAMEQSLTTEQVKNLDDSGNHSLIEESFTTLKSDLNDHQIKHSPNHTSSLPNSLSLKELHIKSEETPSVYGNNYSQQEIQINSRTYIKPKIINYSIINACKNKNNEENSKILLDNMHFQLKNVQSLAETGNNADTEAMHNDCISNANGICTADVTSNIPCSNESTIIKPLALRLESNQISNSGDNENANNSFSARNCQTQKRSERVPRNLRATRTRTSFTREQGLRQLCMYRVAVERERLRSLRLQQKRDRILYRKDVEIQNLKLQILRDLTNQNRETNSINF